MQRSKEYLQFEDKLDEALASDGKIALPNVCQLSLEDGLLAIARAKKLAGIPYRFRVQNFDPPRGQQTHQNAWYAKVFTNSAGMGGRFDGTGTILTADSGKARIYSFALCQHEWDESGANHSRGWHPKICHKCGFDASIDSGD